MTNSELSYETRFTSPQNFVPELDVLHIDVEKKKKKKARVGR
jgi:hypothetical protein